MSGPGDGLLSLEAIRAAAERIAPHLHRTPLLRSQSTDARSGCPVHLKAESLQKTGSFKPRGALNAVLGLDAPARATGLITIYAGNHAQAVAWAARQVGTRAAVVMPGKAPQSKVDAVRGYGAEVLFHDDNATLFDRVEQERAARGATFIHPFDDPVVLAGAGTVGLEITEDAPDVEVVVVPVGGGGLLGGVASAVRGLKPNVRIVGVELAEGPGLGPALAAGKPVPVTRPATVADGMIPPFVGRLPLAIAQAAVDAVVTVTEAEIHDAMLWLFTRCKLVVEGSGAAALAAVFAGRTGTKPGQPVAVILSGGNVDPTRLAALKG